MFAQGREALQCSLQSQIALCLSHMPQATSQYTLLITFLPVWMTRFLFHPLSPQISPFKHHAITSSYRAPTCPIYTGILFVIQSHFQSHATWPLKPFLIFSPRNDAILLKCLLALHRYFNRTFYSTNCAHMMSCSRTSVGRMDA